MCVDDCVNTSLKRNKMFLNSVYDPYCHYYFKIHTISLLTHIHRQLSAVKSIYFRGVVHRSGLQYIDSGATGRGSKPR